MSILGSVLRRTAQSTGTVLKQAELAANDMAHAAAPVVKGTDRMLTKAGKQIADVIAPNPASYVKLDKDGIPTSLSGKGKLMVGGIALAGIGYNGIQERITNDMGQIEGKMYSPTPDYSSYKQTQRPSPTTPPAGADGSLVFALDRTKNGGFL